MLRPLLNAAYWVQVQSMSDRERTKFDASLVAPPVRHADVPGTAPGLAPGAHMLLGMMRGGGA